MVHDISSFDGDEIVAYFVEVDDDNCIVISGDTGVMIGCMFKLK